MQRLQLGELSVAEDFDTCPAFIIRSPKDPRWYMAYVTCGIYLGPGGVPSKIPGPNYTFYSYRDPLESAVSSFHEAQVGICDLGAQNLQNEARPVDKGLS